MQGGGGDEACTATSLSKNPLLSQENRPPKQRFKQRIVRQVVIDDIGEDLRVAEVGVVTYLKQQYL